MINLEALEDYAVKARWWPWKGERAGISIVEYEDTGNLLVLIFKSRDLYFYLPLLRVVEVPEEVRNRGFSVNSECYIEAEYSPLYFKEYSRLKHGWFKGTSSLSGLDTLEVYSAKPLTLESTNAVAEYNTSINSLVLKSYRLLPEVNIEVKMLEQLTRRGYRNIPRVYGFLYYGKWSTGVLMERVPGDVDGGYPFYNALYNSLITGDSAKYHELGLASKLGVIIGELHIALNEDFEDPFFGAELVDTSDVELWSRRVMRMHTSALKRLDEYSASLSDSTVREELDYWRGVLEKEGNTIVEDAISELALSLELYKARTHQDLHLAQMIYTGNGSRDFVIVDFEGEPGRTGEERLMKEPVLRDIASMIRSFHYLSHAALMNALNLTRHEASVRMLREDPTLNWRLRHVYAMTYSYLARILKANIASRGISEVSRTPWRYLFSWIVERAVYELYYESLYRPQWVSIPIVGLIEAKIFKSMAN